MPFWGRQLTDATAPRGGAGPARRVPLLRPGQTHPTPATGSPPGSHAPWGGALHRGSPHLPPEPAPPRLPIPLSRPPPAPLLPLTLRAPQQTCLLGSKRTRFPPHPSTATVTGQDARLSPELMMAGCGHTRLCAPQTAARVAPLSDTGTFTFLLGNWCPLSFHQIPTPDCHGRGGLVGPGPPRRLLPARSRHTATPPPALSC